MGAGTPSKRSRVLQTDVVTCCPSGVVCSVATDEGPNPVPKTVTISPGAMAPGANEAAFTMPDGATLRESGDCTTVTGCPETEITPVREAPVGFGSAENRTLPDPPALDHSTRSQAAFEIALQTHDEAPVTFTDPDPPLGASVAELDESVSEHR